MKAFAVRHAGAALFVALFVATSSPAQEGWVSVMNFPEIQAVKGGVQISEAVPSNEMKRFEVTTVTTVKRHQTNQLISAGVIESGPFTAVRLSLAGYVEGTPSEPATVGVILVPDEIFVLDALKEGIYLFPIEVTMTFPQESRPYGGTAPETHMLAFPRYRVYFYNSGPRTVKAQLYAFLVN